jgi:hypothetical protein
MLTKSFSASSSRTVPKDVRAGVFESSKKSIMRNSRKRVYSGILEYRMRSIQPGNGCELLPQSHFLEGAINGARHRCLECRNRTGIQYQKRMKLFVTCAWPLPPGRLLTNGGYRLRLRRSLYHHWLRVRSRYMRREAGGAQVPIRAHLSARVHSSARRSS